MFPKAWEKQLGNLEVKKLFPQRAFVARFKISKYVSVLLHKWSITCNNNNIITWEELKIFLVKMKYEFNNALKNENNIDHVCKEELFNIFNFFIFCLKKYFIN